MVDSVTVDSSSEQQWLTQLPALLIVTTSMVIDRSLRKDLIEERVRCQIWLWFCMILSLRSHLNIDHRHDVKTEDLICETWMHVTIVSNLVSIGALAMSSPLERIQKSNKGSWWFSFASWTAMMASSCIFSPLRYTEATQKSIAMFSIQVYMISLFILWIIHWHKRRKARLEQEMRNITGSTTPKFVISQDFDGFDRSKWYTWKPSTTLHWISHVLESLDSDIDPGVIQQLASHRIDGPLLDTLSVTQLLQLQVPYGPACHLDQAIQNELVRPFPRPREATEVHGVLVSDPRNAASYNSGQMRPSDFLSGFDQEYNSDRPRSFASKSSNEKTGLADLTGFASGAEMMNLDSNQQDRIGDIMKEKYGLELPRLRSQEGSASEPPENSAPSQVAAVSVSEPPQQQTSIQKKPPPPTLPMRKTVPAAAERPSSSSVAAAAAPQGLAAALDGEIPKAILKQMPPNIQEIAKRRPELVRQMLLGRQLQLQHQREDQLYTHAEEGEYVEEEEEDDETARLIQRKKDHRQYKSTGL